MSEHRFDQIAAGIGLRTSEAIVRFAVVVCSTAFEHTVSLMRKYCVCGFVMFGGTRYKT
jgi:hypothetical protein